MFGNQCVNYGGPGGIRRGLIWQSGEEDSIKWLTGSLDPALRKLKNYCFTYSKFSYTRYIYSSGRIELVLGNPLQPLVFPDYDPTEQAFVMKGWRAFGECPAASNDVKLSGYRFLYGQDGGFNPDTAPTDYNMWYSGNASTNNNVVALQLPFALFTTGQYYPTDTLNQCFITESGGQKVYNTDRISAAGQLTATKFSPLAYRVRNAFPYTGGSQAGRLGSRLYRIARELVFTYTYSNYIREVKLQYVPIPNSYIVFPSPTQS